jgi:hypothetical protein
MPLPSNGVASFFKHQPLYEQTNSRVDRESPENAVEGESTKRLLRMLSCLVIFTWQGGNPRWLTQVPLSDRIEAIIRIVEKRLLDCAVCGFLPKLQALVSALVNVDLQPIVC